MPNPRSVEATVEKVVDHGSNVFSLWLRPSQGVVRFKPGQFLHLALDPFDPTNGYWPESRVFSIASTPGIDRIRIVYSVKGKFTRRMSMEIVEGKSLWLKYPFGDFIVDTKAVNETSVLVAGGTGICPFIGLLDQEHRGAQSLWLYYGVRNVDLVIFQEELERAARNMGLNLELSVEAPVRESPFGAAIRIGTLDIESIHNRHGSHENAHYYLSGPPGMIGSFKEFLVGKLVGPRNIHVDAWE